MTCRSARQAVTAGAIYVVRDPRDVAVSYSAYTGRSIDEIITFMADPRAANRGTDVQVFEFLSSWSAHARSWVGAKNRLLLRYEDLLANPEAAFGRVARFLGPRCASGKAEPRHRLQRFFGSRHAGTGIRISRAGHGGTDGVLPRRTKRAMAGRAVQRPGAKHHRRAWRGDAQFWLFGRISRQVKGKGFFLKKKKQKTFFKLGRSGFSATGLKAQKTAFFKKRPLPYQAAESCSTPARPVPATR